MNTATASIVVDGLGKTYHPSPPWMKAMVRTNITEPVVALHEISFSVGAGEIVAVVGPNGAGKTTTFRILVGLTVPSVGTATVMGLDTARESVAVRGLVGWMPGDDRSLLMRLSCEENLRFHGRMQGMRGRNLRHRIAETLELVELGHAAKTSIFALSAGMRARMQLARALLHDPKVLILDEPTGAVDPVAAHGLVNLIIDIVAERRLAALVSSHRLEEIESLRSRVILLDRGRIRYDGDLDALRDTLDRPCLELEFDSLAAAMEASSAVTAAVDDVVIEMVEPATLRLVLGHHTRAGAVLASLQDGLTSVARVREVRRPLRELLAAIYLAESQEHPAVPHPASSNEDAGA